MEKLSRKLKTIGIHWKQYVEVKERILALVENDSPYSIETDYQYFPEQKMWVVKAKLTMMETWEVFTGLAQEIEWDGNINKTSALENAETSAVGRACAFAWIGIVDWIASVDEINKATNRTPATPAPKQTYTGSNQTAWFNKKELEMCIAQDNAYSKEAIEQWAIDNWYKLSWPSIVMIDKYLNSWEL